jgi:pyruvate,orthophosphate dikinase
VFRSWNNPRAIYYRKINKIDHSIWAPPSPCSRWSSATWATTRPPASLHPQSQSTGEKKFYGEFLVNAQGEDVVAGIRTPEPVAEMPKSNKPAIHKSCAETVNRPA